MMMMTTVVGACAYAGQSRRKGLHRPVIIGGSDLLERDAVVGRSGDGQSSLDGLGLRNTKSNKDRARSYLLFCHLFSPTRVSIKCTHLSLTSSSYSLLDFFTLSSLLFFPHDLRNHLTYSQTHTVIPGEDDRLARVCMSVCMSCLGWSTSRSMSYCV